MINRVEEPHTHFPSDDVTVLLTDAEKKTQNNEKAHLAMASLLRTLAPLVALLPATALAGSKSCPGNLPLSCHNNTAVEDTCCFIPAGQLLQTQFWDTQPATGPAGM